MHPNEQASQVARVQREEQQNYRNTMTHDLTKEFQLRYVHVRREDVFGRLAGKGGVTVAYQLPPRGSRTIVAACSICHERDSYCKRDGRFYASRNFASGERIKLHVPKNTTIPRFLNAMFGVMTYY